MSWKNCHDVEDLRREAKRRLPAGLFNYIDRGTEDDVANRNNRLDFQRIRMLPRALVDVENRTTETRILGQTFAMPLIIAPAGPAGLFWYKGELALARAAKETGVPFALSTYSTTSAEDIARTGATVWQQLYFWKDKRLAEPIISRAENLGFRTLVVTVDTAVLGIREYAMRDRFMPPYGPSIGAYWDMTMHPGWLFGVALRYLLNGGLPRVANLPQEGDVTDIENGTALSQSVTWDDIARLRDRWGGRLLMKGVLRPDEALRAAELGLDGIVISNHGGRNLDSAASTISALPAIHRTVGGRLDLFLDSGVRRGSDIAKALALGATAVLAGAAPLFGIAAGGERGARRALEIFRSELDCTMALCGAADVDGLTPNLIWGMEGSFDAEGRSVP